MSKLATFKALFVINSFLGATSSPIKIFIIFNLKLFDKLKKLEPFGLGNPRPVFALEKVNASDVRIIGKDAKHLKLLLEDESGYTHDAIGFRLGEWQKKMPPRVDVLFTYEPNEFNGRITYQLNLKDIKPAGSAE